MSTTLTYDQGHDEILDFVKAAWDLGPINPVPFVDWEENLNVDPPNGATWARVKVDFSVGPGRLSHGPVDVGNQAMFGRAGILFIQIFVPEGEATSPLRQLGDHMVKALEGKHTTSGIKFIEVNYVSVGPDPLGSHAQVVAAFEYEVTR